MPVSVQINQICCGVFDFKQFVSSELLTRVNYFITDFKMPQKCCVPNCCGNYRKTKEHGEEKVSVFRFPSDPELLAKWLRIIPREGLEVGDKTVVCEKHFVPEFVIRVDAATHADGSILTVPRKIPKLVAEAYPSLFPNNSSYLSSESPKKRKSPADRFAEQIARDNAEFQKWTQ